MIIEDVLCHFNIVCLSCFQSGPSESNSNNIAMEQVNNDDVYEEDVPDAYEASEEEALMLADR